jgi:hypothetical protein
MKSGPDVFADALVPKGSRSKGLCSPRRPYQAFLKVPNPALPFSKSPKLALAIRGCQPGGLHRDAGLQR